MTHEPRSLGKIGVLVPFTNTNLEPDLGLMHLPGYTMHFQRMGGYDADEIPGSDQMAGLGASDISHDLMMLAGVRPAAVLYGCTSATLAHGPAFDADLAKQIQSSSGAVSFTAAGSLIEAIKALGVKKIGFSSPYLGEINVQAVDFMAQNEIETVQRADIGRELGNYGQGELSLNEVFELACQADHPEAEAIVLSCTDMRSVEIVESVETQLGKPVITSNQAMVFCLCQSLGIGPLPHMPGQLFDQL